MAVRRPAYVAVADHLREMILAGALPAGERLPTEAELGAQFGVSRSTIREALKMLSSIRLVATSRGVSGGSMVTVGNPDDVSKLLQVGITQLTAAEKCTVDELLQTREMLEVPAARLAARLRDSAQINLLSEAIPRSLADVDSGRLFELNRMFHRVILEASGNRLLPVLTEPIFYVLQTRFLRDRATPEFWRDVNLQHALILEAVGLGDEELAGSRMQDHLRQLGTTYRSIDSHRRRSAAS